jgi:hypothetical protein
MTTETMTPPTPKYKIGDRFASKTCNVIWEIVDVKIVSKLSTNPITNKKIETLVVKYEFTAKGMLNTKVEEYYIDDKKWYLVK